MTVELPAYAALSDGLGCSAEVARAPIKRPAPDRKLTQAEERVALGYDRIAHQRKVVLEKDDEGLDGAIALAILGQLEILQGIHIAERDRLLAVTRHGNSPPSGARREPAWNWSRVL
jgi:hypothetical protein